MQIKAGQFYLMPPGIYHSHRQDAGTGHVGFAIRWEVDTSQAGKMADCGVAPEFQRMMEQLTEARSGVFEDHEGNVLTGFLAFLDMAKEERYTTTELQLAFLRFIIKISGFYTRNTERVVQGVNQTFIENRTVETAIRFIEENYKEEIDVNDISHSIHLSYSHLSRIFKKHTGETITGYLNGIRLKKAQHLLLCTGKSIGCIAVEVGFNSVHYFCSLFRKYFGITPGAFRRSKQRLSE
jgi:YesN/AraC family two-component response regulator